MVAGILHWFATYPQPFSSFCKPMQFRAVKSRLYDTNSSPHLENQYSEIVSNKNDTITTHLLRTFGPWTWNRSIYVELIIPGNSKTIVAVPFVRRVPEAIGRTKPNWRRTIVERAAAFHTPFPFTFIGSFWIDYWIWGIITIPILTPLPYVAGHII